MDNHLQTKLLIFDVEGVIIPKARFVFFEVARMMGVSYFIKGIFLGLLYEMGLISLERTLKSVYMGLKGLSLEAFISLFSSIPLMPGVEKIFKELKREGFKIALISSGLPNVILMRLSERLGVDYVRGFELDLSEGLLTGIIGGKVIEHEGKAAALKQILKNEALNNWFCIGVADDRNNSSMFKLCDLKIGFNPDFVLSFMSDYVITDDLTKIIPIILGENKIQSSTLSRSKALRETIHIGGFFIPIVCIYLKISRFFLGFLIFIVTSSYILAETRRMFKHSVPLFTGLTERVTEKAEFQEFISAPIFYGTGIFISLFFFPEPIGYVSIAVLTLGDGFAAVIGGKFGFNHIQFNKIKTYEGLVCGFLSAFLGSLLFVDTFLALIASAVGMITEILPLPFNDNLAIPLTSGLALLLITSL